MPRDLTELSEFTDPVTVPVDADPASGLALFDELSPGDQHHALQALANRTRWLKENLGRDIIPATGIVPLSSCTGGAREWFLDAGGAALKAEVDGAKARAALNLRAGNTLTGWQVKVKPGAARLSAQRVATRAFSSLHHFDVAGTAPTFTALAITSPDISTTTRTDDGTTNTQILVATLSTPLVITADMTVYIDVSVGSDGGSHTVDAVYAILAVRSS
jgi:hypothetical protein